LGCGLASIGVVAAAVAKNLGALLVAEACAVGRLEQIALAKAGVARNLIGMRKNCVAARELASEHSAGELQGSVRMAKVQQARVVKRRTAVLRLPGNLGFKRLLVKQHGQPRAGARHKEPVHRSYCHRHLKRHRLLLLLLLLLLRRRGRPVPKDDR
jgi:hypothetical protein